MTTNDLPTPAAWLDSDGIPWKAPTWGLSDLLKVHPSRAPFVPLYRADDLPALVLPEVTEEDAKDAARAFTDAMALMRFGKSPSEAWASTTRSVRDSLASRMRKPNLSDVLPDFPDVGEGEWMACDDADCQHPTAAVGLSLSGPGVPDGAQDLWCFVPATPPDPDADAKAALSDSAGDLDDLRAAGWELVRKEGDR